jgi:hypothetical protein
MMNWTADPPYLKDNDIVIVRMKYSAPENWVVTAVEITRPAFGRDEPYFSMCGTDEGEWLTTISAGLFAFEWGPVVYRKA